MVSGDEKLKKRLIFTATLLFIMVVFSLILGLGRGGFDSERFLFQYFLYVGLGVGSLVGIWALILYERLEKKSDKAYGESYGFYSPGEKPALNLNFFKSPIKLAIASFLLFSFIAMFSVVNQGTAFTGTTTIEQQFTALDSTIFNLTLVVISENLGGAFVFAFMAFTIRFFGRKYTWEPIVVLILSFFFPVLMVGIYGFANHTLRYGANDFNMFVVFLFWIFIGLVTALTGSFIPGAMAHASNNVFVELARFFSSNAILAGASAFLIISTAVFLIFLFVNRGDGNE